MSDAAYVICALNDIPSRKAAGFQLAVVGENGEPKPFPIVVVRWGQQVFGYLNSCPHHGTNLDWEREQFLDPNGLRLMCGKHGALFELGTGRCSDGPLQGRKPDAGRAGGDRRRYLRDRRDPGRRRRGRRR